MIPLEEDYSIKTWETRKTEEKIGGVGGLDYKRREEERPGARGYDG